MTQHLKTEILVEYRGVGDRERKRGSQGTVESGPGGRAQEGKAIMAVTVRRGEIRSNVNLVTYRLSSCGAKLSSLGFCTGA